MFPRMAIQGDIIELGTNLTEKWWESFQKQTAGKKYKFDA